MNYKNHYYRRKEIYGRSNQVRATITMVNMALLSLFIFFTGVLVVVAAPKQNESETETIISYAMQEPINSCELIIEQKEISRDLIEPIDQPETVNIEVTVDPIEASAQSLNETEEVFEVEVLSNEELLESHLGERNFEINGTTFQGFDMPNAYYPDIDYSFQPYMDYKKITNKESSAYAVSRSDNCYTDENGLRRYITSDDQFKVNGQDDYVIALGTYYKPKGECGIRYLIVTTTGYYTAITGDEKADRDTDDMHMFSVHNDGRCGGIIEWIVDCDNLNNTIKRAGTITAGPDEILQGDIIGIYRIN